MTKHHLCHPLGGLLDSPENPSLLRTGTGRPHSPERVLQVVSSGQGDGAEEALHCRNGVQQQRLGEVLQRDTK